MRDVNKIIEMALDFGDHDVTDPYDPDFHKAVGGETVVVYFGTSSDKFWEVMRNGIHLKPSIKYPTIRDFEIHFDPTHAVDKARSDAYIANGERSEGPTQAIMFVAEVKFQKPHVAASDPMSQLVGNVMGAEANTVLPLHIKPNQIVAVSYPARSDAWETPIKKFLQQVRTGQIDSIQPDDAFPHGKFRPRPATKQSWQHVVVRYVNDLLNYSSNLFDYLLGREKKALNDIVIREATKLGLRQMLNWDGKRMMEWVYSILPQDPDWDHTVEDDIHQVMGNGGHEGWNLPFYRLFDKYSDDTVWKYRSGKEEPPPPRSEGGDF